MQGFVPVNFRNLEDAGEIADAHGDRIEARDGAAVREFLASHEVDTAALLQLVQERPDLALVFLSTGSMEGVYLAWPDRREAVPYVNDDAAIEPLQPYDRESLFDVTLRILRADTLEEAARLERPGSPDTCSGPYSRQTAARWLFRE